MVDDESHIRLVDAHAEGNGGDDDLNLVLDEEVLSSLAFLRIETGVVCTRNHALPDQGLFELFSAVAGHAVDDAALASILGDDREDLLERRRAGNNAVREGRAIETRDMTPRW